MMRSFQAAILSYVALAICALFDRNAEFLLFLSIIPITLTALWVAHVLAFTARIWLSRKHSKEFSPGRREMFSFLAKTATVTALASASAGVAFAAPNRVANVNSIHDNTPCPVVTCPNGKICCTKDCGGGKTGHHCCDYGNCVANNANCIVTC